MGWADDLKKLTTKGEHDLCELCKTIKIEMFSGIVSETRFDKGRLRGNWQIQENAPATGEIDRLDPTSAAVMHEIREKATANGNTFFVNNLPYAKVYEEKDAMVARNIQRVKNNIGKMARDIKK